MKMELNWIFDDKSIDLNKSYRLENVASGRRYRRTSINSTWAFIWKLIVFTFNIHNI